MATFDASAVVEPLKYDFTTLSTVPDLLKGAKGVLPEPSDKQIEEFIRAINAEDIRFEKLRPDLPENPTGDDVLAWQDAVSQAESLKYQENVARIFSELCSGELTPEQILAIPRRIRPFWYRWLRKQVTDPEAVTGGGSQQGETRLSPPAG